MRKASHEKTLHYTIGEAGGQIGEIFKQNNYDVVAYKHAIVTGKQIGRAHV